jgi:ABC-type transporter Mla subunit MlaD
MAPEMVDRKLHDIDMRVTRIEGKIDTVDATLAAGIEQRRDMQESLREIARHLRELNGRTRKSEDNISSLQFGHTELLQSLTRSLKTSPDGMLQVITAAPPEADAKPALSNSQKAGMAAFAVPLVLGLFDLLKHALDLGMAVLQKK